MLNQHPILILAVLQLTFSKVENFLEILYFFKIFIINIQYANFLKKDFRVFRDSLNATGADFAYYKNGYFAIILYLTTIKSYFILRYMYHTLIDDMDHIQNGSIQHMGGK